MDHKPSLQVQLYTSAQTGHWGEGTNQSQVMTIYGICITWHTEDLDDAQQAIISNVGNCGIAYAIAGIEHAEDGETPHIQGYIQANHDHYSRFKALFGDNTIHFEKQREDSVKARDYCKKEEDWLEAGNYRFIPGQKARQGTRSDLDKLKEDIDNGDGYEEIMDKHFGCAAKYSKFIKERIMVRDNTKTLLEIERALLTTPARPWQQAVIEMAEGPVDPRKIHWFWDPNGNVGKTWMANYLGACKKAIILDGGRRTDMAYIVAQSPEAPIVVFDCARTVEGFMDGAYGLAEAIKNGRVTSSKYESKTVFFGPKHVFFFANFEPDATKWSQDRYDVTRVCV